ncbi:MAG TPA: YlbF family regulator [Erysipelotrichaceae bacterium]|nr:YlbF family regulator [Erysipelotrichaceae bacterium]
MNKDIYTLSSELKQLLDADERLILLNELEEKMRDNQEVMELAYYKDLAISRYSDLLNHFSSEDKITKKAHRELFLKKKALDEHPLVREYLKAYSQVRDLYLEISTILFSDLNIHLKGNN